MNPRKILAFYVVGLVGLVLLYQNSNLLEPALVSSHKWSSSRSPASLPSVVNSMVTPICTEWGAFGHHKVRRCERTLSAVSWGHFEVLDPETETFPQNGLKLGQKTILEQSAEFNSVLEYWLSPKDLEKIVQNPILSMRLKLQELDGSNCSTNLSPALNIKFLTSTNSISSLKWSEIHKPGKSFSIPFLQEGWQFESRHLEGIERQAITTLARNNNGRLLLYLEPEKFPDSCVFSPQKAMLDIQFLEVL